MARHRTYLLPAALGLIAILICLLFFLRPAPRSGTGEGSKERVESRPTPGERYARFSELKRSPTASSTEAQPSAQRTALVASVKRVLFHHLINGSSAVRDPFSVPGQIQALIDDPDFQKLASELRTILSGQPAGEILLNAFKEFSSDGCKALAVALMGELGTTDQRQQLVKILTDGSSLRVVYASLFALARWKRDEDVSIMVQYYGGTPALPRTELLVAIEHAIALCGKKAIPFLLESALKMEPTLNKDTSALQKQSHALLGLLRDPECVPELIDLANSGQNALVRAMAVTALARTGSRQAMDFVLQELSKPGAPGCSLIMAALRDAYVSRGAGVFQEDDVRRFLNKGLSLDLSPQDLTTCVGIATTVNLAGFEDRAKRILDSTNNLPTDPDLRGSLMAVAIRYLLNQGKIEDVNQAVRAWNEAGADVASALIGVRGTLSGDQLLEWTKAFFANGALDSQERSSALWALEKFEADRPKVADFYRKQLDGVTDPYLRAAIIKSAGQLGGDGWRLIRDEVERSNERYITITALPSLLAPRDYTLTEADVAFVHTTAKKVLLDVLTSSDPVDLSVFAIPDYEQYSLHLHNAGQSLISAFAAFGTKEDIAQLLTLPERLRVRDPNMSPELKDHMITEFSEYVRKAVGGVLKAVEI